MSDIVIILKKANLVNMQKNLEKRIKKLKKKTTFNKGSIGGQDTVRDNFVSGKAILHRTKRHPKTTPMFGAVGSEAMVVYLSGRA